MPFIAAKSLMFVRNTRAHTTSSKLLPAAFRTAERFWKSRSVSATMPPSTTLPVAGSWPTCPLKKRKPSILTACENGPAGGASSGEVIAVLLIASPVATSVADRSLQTRELSNSRIRRSLAGQPTFHNFIIFTIMLPLLHDDDVSCEERSVLWEASLLDDLGASWSLPRPGVMATPVQ